MNDDIVEKIKKILALANDRGATEGEVQAAMARAADIARKHNIELSSVDYTDRKENGKGGGISVTHDSSLGITTKYRQPYHFPIGHTLSEVFGVRIVWGGYWEYNGYKVMKIHFLGETVDVEICKALFPWLEKVFSKALNTATKEGRISTRMADVNGFYLGMQWGIIEVNKRAEAEAQKGMNAGQTNAYAMVLRDKSTAIKELVVRKFPNMRTSKGRRQTDGGAAQLGAAEGRKVNLRQMGGGGNNQRIGG